MPPSFAFRVGGDPGKPVWETQLAAVEGRLSCWLAAGDPCGVEAWILLEGAEAHRVGLLTEAGGAQGVLDFEDRLVGLDERLQQLTFVVLEALFVQRPVE